MVLPFRDSRKRPRSKLPWFLLRGGVEKNREKAVFWYEKSAAQNNPWAQCNLGFFYANEIGVPQNYEMASLTLRITVNRRGAPAVKHFTHIVYSQDAPEGSQYDVEGFERM
ncbi:hypothetical protein BGZ65_005317, partial [Modicella reniformis]